MTAQKIADGDREAVHDQSIPTIFAGSRD